MEPFRFEGPRLFPDLRPGDRGDLYFAGVFAFVLLGIANRDVHGDAVVPIHRSGLSRADGSGRPGEIDVRTPERIVEHRQLCPAHCWRIRFRVHIRPFGFGNDFFPGGFVCLLYRPIGIQEAPFRIQPYVRKAPRQGRESRGGRQAAGEASGHLSGGPHLFSMEFRARGSNTAAILSDQ